MSPNLLLLKELSVKIGKNTSLVQASGGNTSFKENGLIWIKASGKKLKNAIQEDIFLCFDLKDLRQELENNPQNEILNIKNLNGSDLRTSIETGLHAQIIHKVVLHTHPIDVMACSMFSDAQEYLTNLLKDFNWKWVPYCRPGLPLAKKIQKIQKNNAYSVLVLENHGLVISANSFKDAEILQRNVIKKLKQIPRKFKKPHLIKLKKLIKQIPNARLPNYQAIHSLGTDQWSFNLVKRNCYCPDHIVFCGKTPWIVNSLNPPNSVTSYGIVKDVGVFLLENATSTIEEMLCAQAETFLRIPNQKVVNFLSEKECDEILNLESEKYRKKINDDYLIN